MQELVLNHRGRVFEAGAEREAESGGVRDEFELRLPECGALAFRVARGVLRNAEDAEDVAQDALLQAYRKFHELRDPARLRSWVVRISFRLALDRWRSRKRRDVRETAWALPSSGATAPTAEEIAASNEFQARLERSLE